MRISRRRPQSSQRGSALTRSWCPQVLLLALRHQRFGSRCLSTYLEPFLTIKPSRYQFLIMSDLLLLSPIMSRVHGTCGPPLSGNTSSGRCAGHQASSPSCAQSVKSACQGTAICLVTSPGLREVGSNRKGSEYLYVSRRSHPASMPG